MDLKALCILQTATAFLRCHLLSGVPSTRVCVGLTAPCLIYVKLLTCLGQRSGHSISELL